MIRHFRYFFVALLLMVSGGMAYAENADSNTTQPNTEIVQTLQTPVNLNKADVNTLMSLRGVGKVKAQSIVDYRNQHGSFKSIDDLSSVKGFSANAVAKLEKNNPDRMIVQ